MSRVIIHACGGAGVTIASKEIARLISDPNLKVDVRYIDTSRADIDSLKNIEESKVWLVTNDKVNKKIDGSGGVREALDPYITESMEKYVDKLEHSKTDIHIVLSSASGGSGSLIAPRLLHNLKASGASAIYITLIDTSSIDYCETSIKTLTHIDLMGRKYKYSVPTLIVDNKEAIQIVNLKIGIRVELLSLLLSAEHKALDSADIGLFAANGYDKDAHGLVTIGVYKEDTILKLKDSFISTLRVLTTDEEFKVDTETLSKIKQYKIGYISEEIADRLAELKFPMPIYFAITRNNSVETIKATKKELEEKLKINEDKTQLFEESDTVGGISI